MNQIRVHTNLLRQPWAKLWYYCRAVDSNARGVVWLGFDSTCQLLHCAPSTLYHWLRTGKAVGAFRAYQRQGDRIEIWLGGRNAVTKNLNLTDWGLAAIVPLTELIEGRVELSTKIATQRLQSQSFHAARLQLPDGRWNTAKSPSEAIDLIQKSLPEIGTGAKPSKSIFHVSQKRAFVSEGFMLHGTSQTTIADSVGVCDRTVRRHLKETWKRQLCYSPRELANSPELDYLSFLDSEAGNLNFKPQLKINYRDRLSNKTRSVAIGLGKVFKCRGKVWINGCNLYDLNFSILSERQARRQFKTPTPIGQEKSDTF